MILGYDNGIQEHLASDVAPNLYCCCHSKTPPKNVSWGILRNQTLLHCLQHVQPFPPSITIPNSQKKNALFLWPAPYVTLILARLEIWQVLASSTYREGSWHNFTTSFSWSMHAQKRVGSWYVTSFLGKHDSNKTNYQHQTSVARNFLTSLERHMGK